MKPPTDPSRTELLKYWAKDPKNLITGINRRFNHWRSGKPYNTSGTHILDEDWDVLVILDSCRYDTFADRSKFEGQLNHRISKGSATKEFVQGNFTDEVRHDTVYVSAISWYLKLRDEIDSELHAFVNLVDDEAVEISGPDGRKQEIVTPERVTERAVQAADQYPDKRLIIHYGQPHQPYLSDWARERFVVGGGLRTVLHRSDVAHEAVVRGYRENLDRALAAVDTLLEHVAGKAVITADHGELLADREFPIPITYYGHPLGIYVDELVKVPWFVVETSERRDIVAERPRDERRRDGEAVDEQLRNLGYRV